MTNPCSATTYAQFCLDVPRIKLVVDGQRDATLPPPCIYTWLVNLFPDERTGLWFAYWCTQTALADLYIAKLRRIHAVVRRPAHYHLLDDGQQTVEVRTTDHCCAVYNRGFYSRESTVDVWLHALQVVHVAISGIFVSAVTMSQSAQSASFLSSPSPSSSSNANRRLAKHTEERGRTIGLTGSQSTTNAPTCAVE